MKKYRPFFLLLFALAIPMGMAAACQPTDREKNRRPDAWETVSSSPVPSTLTPAPTPQTHTPGPSTPAQPIKATPMPPSSKNPIDLARADLAQRLGLETSQITVVHVQADEFPISNLGCPGKAAQPMPAIVSGIEIVLSARERQHVYRARRQTIVYCGPRP